MTLRNLIYVTGVAALIFVLGDVFAAAQTANLLGGSLDAFGVGVVLVRGGVGLLYVFLAYFARKADDNALRNVVGPTIKCCLLSRGRRCATLPPNIHSVLDDRQNELSVYTNASRWEKEKFHKIRRSNMIYGTLGR
jgi:hypothetical protein